MTEQPKSWRDVIQVHPAADLFPMMPPDELKTLGEDIRKNGMAVPIMVCKASGGGLCLIDGRNRLEALETVGVHVASVFLNEHGELRWQDTMLGGIVRLNRVYPTDLDPYEYVLSANIHRRHLTTEQKREIIAKVLKAQPEKSNRMIAKQIKVDHKTVGAVREKLEAGGEIPHHDVHEDVRGTKQPARKPRTSNADDGPAQAEDTFRSTLAVVMVAASSPRKTPRRRSGKSTRRRRRSGRSITAL